MSPVAVGAYRSPVHRTPSDRSPHTPSGARTHWDPSITRPLCPSVEPRAFLEDESPPPLPERAPTPPRFPVCSNERRKYTPLDSSTSQPFCSPGAEALPFPTGLGRQEKPWGRRRGVEWSSRPDQGNGMQSRLVFPIKNINQIILVMFILFTNCTYLCEFYK